MRRVRRVCVIGAGLSGLACAVAAADAGRHVDVYDAGTGRVDAAAHLDLGPTTVRGIAALGLGDATVRAGFAYHGIDVLSGRGERLSERPTPNLAGPQWPGAIGIRNDALLAVVESAALERGVRLHRGVEIDAHIGRDRETPRFSDAEIDAADLIVLAAGLDSRPRRALFQDAPATESIDAHFWQVLLPRPSTLDRATWVFGDNGCRAMLLPVGLEQAGVGITRPSAALAGCAGGLSRGASLRAALSFAGPVLPSLDSRLDDRADVSVQPIRAALLPAPWHRGRVICVGEAAHALPPHFGQATVQSLTDAIVLGDLLRDDAGRDALPAAYSVRRAAQAARVHALVGQAMRWLQRPDAGTDLPALAAELDGVVAPPG